MIRLGVDTGGTYTDFFASYRGRTASHKVPTTPHDPSRALHEGLDVLWQLLDAPTTDCEIVYGSTTATNALLERRGGRTALVTTAGYEDVVAIGRQARAHLYDFDIEAAKPLVPRSLRFGVSKSFDADGNLSHTFDRRELDELMQKIKQLGAEAVAVCLLGAYADPRSEALLAERLAAGDLPHTLSSRLLPEHREYERTSTTCANAYLQPKVGPVLRRLEGVSGAKRFSVMQSNGGRLSLAAAVEEPVRLLLSGPVGGAVGAHLFAHNLGLDPALALDMGGTSTDVSLLRGGPPQTRHQSLVGGLTIGLPMLDIHTVGAGGGSIAYRDSGGALCVGPQSAGADPGPACLGGQEPTVTDAHVVLGHIQAAHYLGGRLRPDMTRALAVLRRLADALHLDVPRTAVGILQVANVNMENALRVMSLEKGVDTRECSLIAFGGAAGLHAADLLETLQLRAAVVPFNASVLSAFGLAHSAVWRDYSLAVLETWPCQLTPYFEELLKRARRDMPQEGVQRPALRKSVDMRYVGQSFEVDVPHVASLEREFHRLHEKRFGFCVPGEKVEVVAVRVRAKGPERRPTWPRLASEARPVREVHTVYWPGRNGPRQLRTSFRSPHEIPRRGLTGPAIIVAPDTTIRVPPGFRCSVENHALILRRSTRTT